MELIHRCNSTERQHYLLEKHYSFKLKPRLLYVGSLDKQSGWQEEPHAHEFTELVFVQDGRGTVTVDEREYAVMRGDIVVYNAGLVHCEYSSVEEPLELRFLAFDRLEITDLPKNWLLPPAYGCVFHCGGMYPVFYSCFDTLIREFGQRDQFYIEIAQNVSRSLLMYLFRLINQTESTAGLLSGNRTMEQAVAYIEQHYREPITLEALAQACCANMYYLSHLFSRTQGVSVGRYILRRRLTEAQRLLADTALSVGAIAEAVGFADASYFCRVFKKECGITPRRFRTEQTASAGAWAGTV